MFSSLKHILSVKILHKLTVGSLILLLFLHVIGIPIFLMLCGFSTESAFFLAGQYLLIYNLVGGVVVVFVLGHWLLETVLRLIGLNAASILETEKRPALWLIPVIVTASYFLYLFVNIVMLRDEDVELSFLKFGKSYFEFIGGVLSSSSSPYE